MAKRGKLEIMRDVLKIIHDNHNSVKTTPLLRATNISSGRFKEYLAELLEKDLIKEVVDKNGEKFISLTDKGFKFLDKYKVIVSFIEEFEL